MLHPRAEQETWMEHAIIPKMSNRVPHHAYMRTHVHPLKTIYDPMSKIPCNPPLSVD